MLAFPNNLPQRPTPTSWWNRDLFRKVRQAQFHIRYPPLQGLCSYRLVMCGFVVYSSASFRAGSREVINRDPGKDFIWCPGISVGPEMKLLINPGEEGNWAVS